MLVLSRGKKQMILIKKCSCNEEGKNMSDAKAILNSLNSKFKSQTVKFEMWHDAFPAAFISNKFCKGIVSPYGAHIASFVPNGQKDVLWMSSKSNFIEGKAIRGGIPVCWPWFGPAGDPPHGIGRIAYWELDSVVSEKDGSDTLTFKLKKDMASAIFKVNFGASLDVELTTENTSSNDLVLSQALHTYFAVSEITKATVGGLAGKEYLRATDKTRHVNSGDITFSAETDMIFDSSDAVCIITDSGWNRKIKVEKSGSNTTVVWNPWIEKSKKMADYGDEEYHGMVCVEAANAHKDARTLAPGKTHKIGTRVSLV